MTTSKTRNQSNLPRAKNERFEIGEFDFHGSPVTVLSNESGNWAVLGQLCRNLDLDAEGQRQMLLRKSWSQSRTCKVQVQVLGDTQAREQFLIHERIVPMWLANISTGSIRDLGKRQAIERAQIELADALYTYVTQQGQAKLGDVTRTALARARERVDYKHFLDLMTGARDYNARSSETRKHFAKIQNAFYQCLVGMTAAQLLQTRTLQTWDGRENGKPEPSQKSRERKIAKNYLTEPELCRLGRLVGKLHLDAEDAADEGASPTLEQWHAVLCHELASKKRRAQLLGR